MQVGSRQFALKSGGTQSGDTRNIFWLDDTKEQWYFGTFRPNYPAILNEILEAYPDFRMELQTRDPKCQFERDCLLRNFVRPPPPLVFFVLLVLAKQP